MIVFSQKRDAKRMPAIKKKHYQALFWKRLTKPIPSVLIQGCHVTHLTYWYNDGNTGWYSEWYPIPPVVVFVYDRPNFFEVASIDQLGAYSRAIYYKYDYWYETRSKINGLPKRVIDALNKSEYVG